MPSEVPSLIGRHNECRVQFTEALAIDLADGVGASAHELAPGKSWLRLS